MEKTVEVLGTGSSQIILAIFVGLLIATIVWLGRELKAAHRDRLSDLKDSAKERSADTAMVTGVLRDFKVTVDLALAALRGGRP